MIIQPTRAYYKVQTTKQLTVSEIRQEVSCWIRLLLYLYINMLVRTYVHHSSKVMYVTCGNMQIQSKEGRIEPQSSSIRPSTQVSSYGLHSTMNLDALSVQRYKEVRGERKKKRNMIQKSIATLTAASLARLAKIETSKGLETAVSLGQQRMHGCSRPR